nr:MAG TPA: hypothetical protein [Caudoviricetes sp.]
MHVRACPGAYFSTRPSSRSDTEHVCRVRPEEPLQCHYTTLFHI